MKSFISILLMVAVACVASAKNLLVFNIVPATEGMEKELAEDIVRIQKDRIADTSLMIFTLVPEGNPPIDKIAILGKRFEKVREHINGRANWGILLQSTLGHGYVLKNKNNLEHLVRFGNLQENEYKCCPLGENTIKYMQDICRKSAQLKPSHIMIDDDFRMYTSANNAGCLCPLHLEKISEKLGRKITAKEAQKHLYGKTEENKRVAKIIDEVVIDSICELAQKMRDAIDEVDPTIRGSVCICNADIRYAERLGKIFAGKGYEPIIRINNARYAKANETPRNFAKTMYSSIQQLAPLKGKAIVLAETDTLPHNRYGTSARSLHANYCGYIIDGCQGSKQWITSTSEFEVGGNEAYRKILSEHADFYEALAEVSKNIVSRKGVATLIPEKPYYNMNPFDSRGYGSITPWAQTFCCVLGIPTNFEYLGKNAGFLNADELKLFSNEDIKKQLARGLVLDAGAAVELCKRGFAKYIGVDATFYKEHIINAEIISNDSLNGNLKDKIMVIGSNLANLKPNSPKTRVLSNFVSKKFSQDDRKNFKVISPASTLFENELGGKVFVVGSYIVYTGWNSYTRYPRKEFMLNVFNYIDEFAYWYPYDAEMYVKSGTLKDGSEVVGLFNFGWDPREVIELGFSKEPKEVKILNLKGKWEKVEFEVKKDKKGKAILEIKKRLEPMYPLFFNLL